MTADADPTTNAGADATDGLTPAEAFAILGNDLRVAVLRVLATAEAEAGIDGQPYGLSFSELYEGVDAANTSQFAYHLDRLDGVFVHEDERGYRLTDTGDRIARAILAGTYNERPTFEPVALDGFCPACSGTALEADYDGETLVVSCTSCGTGLLNDELAPGQVADRPPDAVMESYAARIRAEHRLALDGVCGACYGPVGIDIHDIDGGLGGGYLAAVVCEQCGRAVRVPVEFALLDHPAVVAFYWERGVDIAAEPVWRLFRYVADEWETTATGDPAPFAVTARHAGDELRAEVTADLGVASVEVRERQVPRDDGTGRRSDGARDRTE